MALSYWIACVNIGLFHFADVADGGLGVQVAIPDEASANDPFAQGDKVGLQSLSPVRPSLPFGS